MLNKVGVKLFGLLIGLMLLLGELYAPEAAAAPMAGSGQIIITALPNRVMNGNTITFYARCVNPSLAKVTGAGFYVGQYADSMQKIDCVQTAQELSLAASLLFEAQISLPKYADGFYRAFILCGGEEILSDTLPFRALPPLPSPSLELQNGAKVTAKELDLSWEAVDGAAWYGITLQDTTKGGGGAMLLGRDADDAAVAWHWVNGNTTHVQNGSWRSKLISGHTYRLSVCAAYDKQNRYGKTLDFQIISKSTASGTKPQVDTGLYYKNGDGTVTLYGAVDSSGRQLSQVGFLVGKTENALKRRQIENPDEFAGGAYSLTVTVKSEDTGVLYYRAYAKGKNGREERGELKKIDFSNPDPFEPVQKTAEISESYIPLLSSIDKDWSFSFIKKLPYNYSNTEIQLLNDWEEQHILKGFPFPGKALNINIWAINQYEAAARALNNTKVKLVYKDGSIASFLLKDLVQTAASYNSRYIYPTLEDNKGNKLMPHLWNWRLSLHSWGVSVDINAAIRINRQKGINFAAIRSGAVRLAQVPGKDIDGAIVLKYDGFPERGKLVPDDVSNYILYELAFKKAGFYWGAYFGNNRTDPMHFTLIEVPAKKDIPLREAKELTNE